MAQIDKPNLHFNTVLYTGNETNPKAITGVGFQPDWVWIKTRDTSTKPHMWFDAVRGVYKNIRSDVNNAEDTNNETLTAFGTDGFTLGNNGKTNLNGAAHVAWNWKAGGGQGSSNTSGTINTTYTSANTTAGFSISQYTGNGSSGATVGHGLGAVPKLIIVKALNTSDNWEVYHASLGAEKYIELNLTATQADSTAIWNDTEPTSSVFSIGNNSGVNTNGNPYIAYCFAEKIGYSKISSYKGNGNSTNGPFVYTGFKPAFVIGKKTNGNSDNWYMLDNKRIGYNEDNYWLYPNLSNTEYGSDQSNHTAYHADLLSNGFKLRSSDDMVNGNGNTYVFWAFAENPIVGSNNVPAVAR